MKLEKIRLAISQNSGKKCFWLQFKLHLNPTDGSKVISNKACIENSYPRLLQRIYIAQHEQNYQNQTLLGNIIYWYGMTTTLILTEDAIINRRD